MGTPGFAVPCLEYLAGPYEIAAVYTREDKPAGRGRATSMPPVKEAALKLGLPVVQAPRLKAPEAVAQLAAFRPDVVVVAAYGQILPQAVLSIPRLGCVNVHPSLLPRHRGAAPVAAAILAGDEFTGVSIMLMDEGLDTGPVLARAQVPVDGCDTTGSLTDKLALVGCRVLLDTLLYWSRGEIAPRPQNAAEATYVRPLEKESGEIDWKLPAVQLERQVRAYQPQPTSYTFWQGKQLKILAAAALPAGAGGEPGRVVLFEGKGQKGAAFGVITGEGVLGVCRVQLEGRKALSAAEFLRGQRQLAGAVLPLR